MDDGEGGLSFDFEGGLDTGPTHPTASVPVIQSSADAIASAALNTNANNPSAAPQPVTQTADGMVGGGGGGGRRSFRQTVGRHWLRSLCMKGDACGFLHQYDKSRMPVCRFFRLYGECREQDCVYKHTNEDIKECNMYKLGFCPNGPDCRYRHAKLLGPPPPVEEVLQKIQQLTSHNYGNSNRFFQNRNTNFAQQTEKSQFQGPNGTNQVGKASAADSGNLNQQGHQSKQQGSQGQTLNLANEQQNQASRTATPLPQGTSRYFVVKSCNRENFELSIQQGVWATQRSNEAKLNEAFESVENVILIFSVNKTRHFQGCAKMTSRIGGSVGGGNWKHAYGTAHYGRNFAVKWLKYLGRALIRVENARTYCLWDEIDSVLFMDNGVCLGYHKSNYFPSLCELSFNKTRHLRNPYNENLPVKISRDCQELEPSVGEQLASLLHLEPDSDLMAVSLAAESKREEEKAKGLNLENGFDNPDIVPFEDNEEEDDDKSEEEDERFGEGFGIQGGRGRGRGMMWPPHLPLGRAAHLPLGRAAWPFPGMRGFPPNMMGSDGFNYGPLNPDGFPMPDFFGMPPRGFGPYGPRFSGDFPGPASRMMFPGRPAGGYGMMTAPGRPPFMGGMGLDTPAAPRAGRPPFYPSQSQPSQNSVRTKRDHKPPTSDRNDNSDKGRGQETASSVSEPLDGGHYQHRGKSQREDNYSAGNNYRNGESESEDEAPRRSRQGEGKKKRRSVEGTDSTAVSDEPV